MGTGKKGGGGDHSSMASAAGTGPWCSCRHPDFAGGAPKLEGVLICLNGRRLSVASGMDPNEDAAAICAFSSSVGGSSISASERGCSAERLPAAFSSKLHKPRRWLQHARMIGGASSDAGKPASADSVCGQWGDTPHCIRATATEAAATIDGRYLGLHRTQN
jgi:hypothetical protein